MHLVVPPLLWGFRASGNGRAENDVSSWAERAVAMAKPLPLLFGITLSALRLSWAWELLLSRGKIALRRLPSA